MNNLFDALQNLQFDYIENRLSSIEDAITEVNDHSGDVVKLKEIVSSLVDKKNNLRSAYLERARHLEDNSKIKVILYYKTGEGFSPQTLIASNRLKALGYKTDIWTTHPGNVADARADIAKDFKGATAAIDANKSAIAVSDQEKYHAMEIKNELTSLNIFHDMPVVPVDLEPNSVFLQRPPEEDYPKSAIILVFVLSET